MAGAGIAQSNEVDVEVAMDSNESRWLDDPAPETNPAANAAAKAGAKMTAETHDEPRAQADNTTAQVSGAAASIRAPKQTTQQHR